MKKINTKWISLDKLPREINEPSELRKLKSWLVAYKNQLHFGEAKITVSKVSAEVSRRLRIEQKLNEVIRKVNKKEEGK